MFSIDDDYDGYLVDEESDDEDCNSSGDEALLEFETHFIKTRKQQSAEFEDEMQQELTATMNSLENAAGLSNIPAGSSEQKQSKPAEQQFYDGIYFDSDSDDEQGDGEVKKKAREERRRIRTNDELLYDPGMDDDDQRWIDAQRRRYQPHKHTKNPRALPNSDAVLNCPACMSLLCLDCQRHEIYSSQYRAMFVMNCKVDNSQQLRYPVGSRRNRKRRQRQEDDQTEREQQLYHPVKCSVCNTEVAVYDKDEVYHFFNVLSSFA